jgi:hypothetical protein
VYATGNPRVYLADLYPYPPKPVTRLTGTGLGGYGYRSDGSSGYGCGSDGSGGLGGLVGLTSQAAGLWML